MRCFEPELTICIGPSQEDLVRECVDTSFVAIAFVREKSAATKCCYAVEEECDMNEIKTRSILTCAEREQLYLAAHNNGWGVCWL